MRSLFVLLSLFSLNSVCSFAQSNTVSNSIEQVISDLLEEYVYESEVEMDIDTQFETLFYLYRNPIDLNSAEKDDFENLFFLSPLQIENLFYYRYKVGMFKSIYELLIIEGIDRTDIRRMLPFITLTNPKIDTEKIKFKSIIKYGKNEISSLFESTIEDKEGYKKDMESSGYSGNKLHQVIKYRFNYKDNYYLNITSEKDAGEQFWADYNKGYDFLSASFQMKNKKLIRNLIIGDYQVNYGQGLVVHQGFRVSKSNNVTNIFDYDSSFKRYGSTNEFNFFRGLAATFQLGKANLNMFYSNKQIDGNVKDGVFTGFYQTGYHRTTNEIEKKNLINQQTFGVNTVFRGRFYRVGISSVYLKFDKPLVLKYQPYNLFYFQGDRQWVNGVNYQFKWQKFNVMGEIATTDFQSYASLAGLTFSPISRINFAVLLRKYDPEFNSLYSSSFSESSSISNENGIYIGVELFPMKKWKFSFYSDTYRFPWLRYGINFPSYGREFLFNANFNQSRNLNLTFRIKYEQKEIGQTSKTDILQQKADQVKFSFRTQATYEEGIFKFKQQIDANYIYEAFKEGTYGIAAYQEISVKLKKIPLNFDLRYSVFDTQNYDNRIYTYENDVLYAFSIPAFYGLGAKYYINLRYDITSKLACWVKFSQILYSDSREIISSGNEAITGNRKTDVKLLIRMKF